MAAGDGSGRGSETSARCVFEPSAGCDQKSSRLLCRAGAQFEEAERRGCEDRIRNGFGNDGGLDGARGTVRHGYGGNDTSAGDCRGDEDVGGNFEVRSTGDGGGGEERGLYCAGRESAG